MLMKQAYSFEFFYIFLALISKMILIFRDKVFLYVKDIYYINKPNLPFLTIDSFTKGKLKRVNFCRFNVRIIKSRF